MLMNGFQGSIEGTELPALTDPATAADIQSGKQAVSQDGVKLTGTLPLLDEYTSGGTPTVVGSGSLRRLQIGCRARSDMILRYRTPIDVNTLLTNLGDAAASEVLSGKTFTSTAGLKVSGAMPDQGAKTAALNAGGSYTIPAGYHNGSGKVTANSLASQTPATAAAADLRSGKTAWVNGAKITGTAWTLQGDPPALGVLYRLPSLTVRFRGLCAWPAQEGVCCTEAELSDYGTLYVPAGYVFELTRVNPSGGDPKLACGAAAVSVDENGEGVYRAAGAFQINVAGG